MAETRPKPEPEPLPAGKEDRDSGVRELVLQTEILDELRRMNRLMASISRGPRRYTLAFFSGIVRGLGAAIGATVVFALLVGVLSRVNTIPLIGSYLAKVYEFAAKTSPVIGEVPIPKATMPGETQPPPEPTPPARVETPAP